MPAKAGIQNYLKTLDTRLRGYDIYEGVGARSLDLTK